MNPSIIKTGAYFLGDGEIEFREAPMPELPEEWVRLRVEVCALCGSDKRLLASGASVVPGHEIVGKVVDPGNTDTDVGTRAAIYIPVACQTCEACLDGRQNSCYRLESLVGWQIDGGFATYVDTPKSTLLPVPNDIPPEVAVLALDTFGTAAHALRMGLRTQQSIDSLLVVGCGPLGLGLITVAQAMGIANISVTDPDSRRRGLALELGADQATDFETINQYQVVAEVSGSDSGRALAQNLVKPGGAILAIGESNTPYEMPATPRWRRTDCFTIRTFYFPTTDAPLNWDLLRLTGQQLCDLIMEPTDFKDLANTFERFVDGELVKPFVRFKERDKI